MKDFANCCFEAPAAEVDARLGDARHLRIKSESVDLVFTSPPYATALDYPRAHFLAVPWMTRILGVDLSTYISKTPEYIGSERGRFATSAQLAPELSLHPATWEVIEQLRNSSLKHAKLTQRYFLDMRRVLSEISRVLKPKRHAIIVICPSHIRKIEVPTQQVLTEIGRNLGLRLKRQYTRIINERRRLLPYIQDSFGKRMDVEYVLIFQKS
jgi:DNA modification methylase